jgi:hypothetical protein
MVRTPHPLFPVQNTCLKPQQHTVIKQLDSIMESFSRDVLGLICTTIVIPRCTTRLLQAMWHLHLTLHSFMNVQLKWPLHQGCHADVFGRTDNQTMAAGASVT